MMNIRGCRKIKTHRYAIARCTRSQWRRFVVKSGVRTEGLSGQAIKLLQITPYVNDFQTFNNPGSGQPVDASKENSFTFHF